MHQARPTDLETLLRRHLPKDTDSDITDCVVDQWKTSLATATRVIVARVDNYGPKLQASWLDPEGRIVAAIARPFPRASSVRTFVRDWERYMRKRGVRASVT
jgi:hypothetical protein